MRKRMENYEEPAPDGLWDDIERVIDARKTPVILQPAKPPVWKRVAAVAAMLAIAITCTLFLLLHTDAPTSLPTDTPATTHTLHAQREVPSPQIQAEQPAPVQPAPTPRLATARPASKPHMPAATADIATPALPANDTIGHTTTTADTTTTTREYGTQPLFPAQPTDEKRVATRHIIPERSSKRVAQWSANLFVSNVTPGSNVTTGYAQLSAPYDAAQAPAQYANENTMLPMMSIIRFNANESCNTETKHSQPIRTGLTVRYNIDRRWSIESGVTYTMLHSQLQSGSQNYYYLTNQTLHYIGIPVKINFNIWGNRWFLFYVSGGMMIEKCVDGELTTDYVMNNRATSDSAPISTKPLQWSLNAAAGAQFNILPQLGLYIEPGGSFYFDDGTTIENIYKEKPLNFSLELGLRVSIR